MGERERSAGEQWFRDRPGVWAAEGAPARAGREDDKGDGHSAHNHPQPGSSPRRGWVSALIVFSQRDAPVVETLLSLWRVALCRALTSFAEPVIL